MGIPVQMSISPNHCGGLKLGRPKNRRVFMRVTINSRWLISLVFGAMCLIPVDAQQHNGSISGTVSDSTGGALPGAKIELQPGDRSSVSDAVGQFQIQGVVPGSYKLKVSYLGFALLSTDVTFVAQSATNVTAVLQVATADQTITVSAGRERGEAEALNIERTSDSIIQVLPADVLTSLPNANVADAVGRMPSVSVERDEGEAKYIQIRGTEPRLSNVTINGLHLPSPENVRNVKLDIISADIIDRVEVSKTLSANQDADAIGGTVNLVTAAAANRPTVVLSGIGGYTHIGDGRLSDLLSGSVSRRFGANKKFGLAFGGSEDYNQRGINDVEPAPGIFTLPNGSTYVGFNGLSMNDYLYNRTRYGFAGQADYRLGQSSSIYFRGLFSKFNDLGVDWTYAPSINNFVSNPTDANNTCGITSTSGTQGCGGIGFQEVNRHPLYEIWSGQLGAMHILRGTIISYEIALSQATSGGGFDIVTFSGPGTDDNSLALGVTAQDPFVPKFPVLNGVNIYDPTKYTMSPGSRLSNDDVHEVDVVGDISASRMYSIHSHSSTFEVGAKGWNAKKTQQLDQEYFNSAGLPMSRVLSGYTDKNYYFGKYTYNNLQFGPVTDYSKVYAAASPDGFTPDTVYILSNFFNIDERIYAGYAMNTINIRNLRLRAGVRVEATEDTLQANKLNFDSDGNWVPPADPVNADSSYINIFPSAEVQYRLGSDTVLRTAYSMGIARPNFGDLAPYFLDRPGSIPEFSKGNPDLKPTHAQNFDLLAEHYLKPVGILQVGFFYKALTDPIFAQQLPYAPKPGAEVESLFNGPAGHILGIEASWQQQLKFLPGALNGLGVSANYSHLVSRASFPSSLGRVDSPTLLRTAPNTYNVDVTYDKAGISARMGLNHDDAYIYSYGGSSVKDPSGDTYIYPHTQLDVQVSYIFPRMHGLQAVVSGLNLNNEVFGFYAGAEKYPLQREYYNQTFSGGLRWVLPSGRKEAD
jgi:TonB-dependent receptor